jgi:hypothetical protein
MQQPPADELLPQPSEMFNRLSPAAEVLAATQISHAAGMPKMAQPAQRVKHAGISTRVSQAESVDEVSVQEEVQPEHEETRLGDNEDAPPGNVGDQKLEALSCPKPQLEWVFCYART